MLDKSEPCARLRLCDLMSGKPDALGNTISQILWLGPNYAVYRSDDGVCVQFSDDAKEEMEQRQRFGTICSVLCELRYLTSQMRTRWWPSKRRGILYDHNIASVIMLALEGNANEANRLAGKTLDLAVERATNDNTIRYIRACFIFASICVAIGFCFLSTMWSPYVIAAMFGAAGATFSVATRLQRFKLKPCNQSQMNYWMSVVRVSMGVLAAVALMLLIGTMPLATEIKGALKEGDWQIAAMLGLIAGFCERLVPNIINWTSKKIGDVTDSKAGTAVQAAREQTDNERGDIAHGMNTIKSGNSQGHSNASEAVRQGPGLAPAIDSPVAGTLS